MDGTSAWLLLSLWAATPQPPSQAVHAPPASGAAAVQWARADTTKKDHRRAHHAPKGAQGPSAPGQPATPSPQLQSKRTLLPLPTDYRAVALWPLSVDENDLETGAEIEGAVLDAIEALRTFRSISPRDVETDLESQNAQPDSCDRDVVCMARMGRMARAHLVLEIRLVPTGGITNLQARLIDTVAEREVLRLEEPLAPSAQERTEQMRGLIVQCLTPADYVGSLQVRCDAAVAQVFLDGQKLGDNPVPPIPRVQAGVHVLRVVRPGHSDVHRFIDVQFGRANIFTVHDVDDRLTFESVLQDVPVLPPPPKPIVIKPWKPPHFPSWRTWTAVGLAGAGALGVGAGGYLASELRALNREQATDADMLATLGFGDPQSVALLKRLGHLNDRGPRLERGQWIAVGAGAGFIGVGAALVAWDWLRVRYAVPPPAPKAPGAAEADIKPVLLVPTWMAGHYGLQLNLTF